MDAIAVGSLVGNFVQLFFGGLGIKLYLDAMREGKENLKTTTQRLEGEIGRLEGENRELKSDPYLARFNQDRIKQYQDAVYHYRERATALEDEKRLVVQQIDELKRQLMQDRIKIEGLEREVGQLEQQVRLNEEVAEQAERRRCVFENIAEALETPFPPLGKLQQITSLEQDVERHRELRSLREKTEPLLIAHKMEQLAKVRESNAKQAEREAKLQKENQIKRGR